MIEERESKKRIQLQKIWYAKLRKEGFDDIEVFDPSGSPYDILRYKFERSDSDGIRDDEEYYRVARQFCHTFSFSSRLERIIWETHADGFSYRDIAKLVKKKYWAVFSTVNLLKECMIKGLYGEDQARHLYESRRRDIKGFLSNRRQRRKVHKPR